MHFLPADVVPNLKADGPEVCKKMLGQINFYIEVLKKSGMTMKSLEKMFRDHVSWHKAGTLQIHERSMLCALATVLSGSDFKPGPHLNF